MKRLLLVLLATATLVVGFAAPASADVGVAVATAESEHGEAESGAADDGTDLATFLALMAGGVVVVLALAALVRAGRRIPS